jgi:quinol-cytochrome oxidoreductase complex cytochrome b subunit
MSPETEAKSVEQSGSARRFFPDFAFLEALVALALLGGLVLLAAFTKPPLQAVAGTSASGYVPRPEWYFLWLFQLLKYFKGSLEVVGTTIVPAILVALLAALPFLDRRRQPKTRRLLPGTRPVRLWPRVVAAAIMALLLAATLLAATSTPAAKPTPPRLPAPVWPMRVLPGVPPRA